MVETSRKKITMEFIGEQLKHSVLEEIDSGADFMIFSHNLDTFDVFYLFVYTTM